MSTSPSPEPEPTEDAPAGEAPAPRRSTTLIVVGTAWAALIALLIVRMAQADGGFTTRRALVLVAVLSGAIYAVTFLGRERREARGKDGPGA